MKLTEEQKRRADLVKIIGLKQAALDAKVARLGHRKTAIDQRKEVLRNSIRPPNDMSEIDGSDLVLLAKAVDMAARETARLDQDLTDLSAKVRRTLSESVSLEIAKRKIKAQR